MTYAEVNLLLLSLFATTWSTDFQPYISIQQRTIGDVVGTFSTSSSVFCLQRCEQMTSCESVSYSSTEATCRLHDKRPGYDYVVTLTGSPTFTLFYHYSCQSGWYMFRGKCYFFSETSLSWEDSKVYCSSKGASFVKIESNDEQEFIGGTAAERFSANSVLGHIWLGGYYSSTDGEFLWYDQTSIGYTAWGGTNPNINSGCVDITYNLQWGWNDHVDCFSLLPFICEKDLVIQIP